MPVITLTTDFGLSDGYVGAMKGVLLGICPQATLVDITHDIPPQDVRQAAWTLATAVPYFPPQTVHLVVVDPGVGSARRPLAIRSADAFFVGPDNGVFTYILKGLPFLHDESGGGAPHARLVVALDNPRFWGPALSATFHGRDLFAPVAAHLAAGAPITAMGTPAAHPVSLEIQQPTRQGAERIQGHVLHIDRFGNLISNIPAAWLEPRDGWVFTVAGQRIEGLQRTYAAAAPGALLALISSMDTLEIAARAASAARLLGVAVGEPIAAARHNA